MSTSEAVAVESESREGACPSGTTRFDTRDTFGVLVDYSLAAVPDWDTVAICDTAEAADKVVERYQQLTRGKNRITVDRLPRHGGLDQPPGECGYCGREHWEICETDELGNAERGVVNA